ncbi:MAG: DUF4097 family beta strand repeat-containing protein [Dokdonella sp.]
MRTLFSLALLCASTLAAAESPCKFTAERNFDIDPAGLSALGLVLGSSDLVMEGSAGGKIEVRGRACASSQEQLDRLVLTQHRDGGRLTVEADSGKGISINLFGSNYAYIDLHVRVPNTLPIDINAGSGDSEINDIGPLAFHSGSGDLRLRNSNGEVSIQVGSGDAIVSDIGKLTVTTGSGDIRAERVHGPVHVEHGGSGDLSFASVDGGATVDKVGSGDVDLRDIGGDVEIGSIGSGDIEINGVRGNLTVRSHGSGDIHHRNVSGQVDVPRDRD